MTWILFVFFLSGAVSLLYEVVWMRQLSLIFGITTYATAAVLAIRDRRERIPGADVKPGPGRAIICVMMYVRRGGGPRHRSA